MPPVSVIVPCKGLDFELEKNVEAIFRQVYPFWRSSSSLRPRMTPQWNHSAAGCEVSRLTRFACDGRNSPTAGESAQSHSGGGPGRSGFRGLCFHRLGFPPPPLLAAGIGSALRSEQVGLSTGYRWYYPTRGNLASVFRSAWNGSIATLLGNHNHNFAWGGSMAIRKGTFHRARVLDYWQRSISDDYSMTRAMKDAKLRIHYEPRCLIGSYGRCSWGELLEWSTRQMILTKVYSRKLWQLALVSQWTFSLVWWWALAGVVVVSSQGEGSILRPFGAEDTEVRSSGRAVVPLWCGPRLVSNPPSSIRPEHRDEIQGFWWGYVLLFLRIDTDRLQSGAIGFGFLVEWRERYEFGSAQNCA
jgi:hypothetical protein